MSSGRFPDDFEFITAMQSAKARAEDLDRFNRAQAGLETGDGNSHNNKERDKALLAARRGGDISQLTALEQALSDPGYAQAYQGLADTLSAYESATASAISEAESDIADMEANAARLPDGTVVFRDANGDVYTADGEKVGPDVAAGVEWPEGAASREDYLKRKKELEELRRYEVEVLGRARDRMNDPDNPPSKDELRELQRDIEEKAPEAVRRSAEVEAPEVEHEKAASHEIDVFKFD